MTLILLALLLTMMLCVIAWHLAIFALPVMAAIIAFRSVHATDAGFLLSTLAAIGAAILSIAVLVAVVGFARNPALRIMALALFSVPAAVAGYALVFGVAKHAIDSAVVLNLLGGLGGLVIGVAALCNLNAIGRTVLSR